MSLYFLQEAGGILGAVATLDFLTAPVNRAGFSPGQSPYQYPGAPRGYAYGEAAGLDAGITPAEIQQLAAANAAAQQGYLPPVAPIAQDLPPPGPGQAAAPVANTLVNTMFASTGQTPGTGTAQPDAPYYPPANAPVVVAPPPVEIAPQPQPALAVPVSFLAAMPPTQSGPLLNPTPAFPPDPAPNGGGGGGAAPASNTTPLLIAGGVVLFLLYAGRKKKRGR